LAVDLFSGAGGLSLGLANAGWTVAAAVDHDQRALETHRANFPGLTLDLDLAERRDRRRLVRMLREVEIDLVAGGPPCQPFSRAGRSKIQSLVDAGLRDPDDHRRGLWRAFVEVVEKVLPRAVLMENVPDMALGDDLLVVRTIVDRLEVCGYRTQVRLVNAWRHGVPQHRQRMILLARRDGGSFDWPAETDRETTLREAIGDLPRLGNGTGGRRLEHRPVGRLPRFASAMRRGAERGVVHDHMTRPVRDDDLEVFKLMTPKTLYSEIPEDLRRYKADTFDDKYKRLGWDGLSRSITAHIARDGYWYIHPEEHRTLTVREAARIQTFPDWFRFAGPRSDAFRQIGNAVPPMLGEAAARALAAEQVSSRRPDDDRDWRAVHARLSRWAASQRKGENWYLIPGSDLEPAVAVLVAMLRGAPELGAVLAPLRGARRLDSAVLKQIQVRHDTPLMRSAVDRLSALAHRPGSWANPDQLIHDGRLKPAEAELFLLLIGVDLLCTTQGAIRVAARVLGSDSYKVNRRSAGRLDLARVVGAGERAPARMAAVRLLGATLCRAGGPDKLLCAGCPLRSACRTAAVTSVT
jgi:DNA (cytosine-5)-methyltransferase 1